MGDERKGEAHVAAMRAARATGEVADEPKITDERFIEAVRLLSPKPGDIVVFHVRDGLTAQEFDEFLLNLRPLKEHCPGVMFLAAERVDDITVVRPENEPKTLPTDVRRPNSEGGWDGRR